MSPRPRPCRVLVHRASQHASAARAPQKLPFNVAHMPGSEPPGEAPRARRPRRRRASVPLG
eukprot:5576350-Alexandrium_andersonii.AAC.1